LFGVLQHSGVELSAHQTIEAEQEHWSSLAQITAEYLTIAAEAQRDRWVAEFRATGLDSGQVDAIVTSDSFGPLAAELRRAESTGVDIAAVLLKVVTQRSLDDAEDVGAVLISRLLHAKSGARRGRPRKARLIAGLISVADGPMSDEMRTALAERHELLEERATALAEAAVSQRPRWVRKLGDPPADPHQREVWMQEVRVVAAYRDLYDVDSDSPVGPAGATDGQRIDEARARKSVRRAASIAEEARDRESTGLASESPVLLG